MASVQFQTEIERPDGVDVKVHIEAEVTTWRDEGPINDGPLMASVEDLTAYFEDGSNVPNSIVELHYQRWSDRACELAVYD